MIPIPTIARRRDGVAISGQCCCVRRWQHPVQFLALVDGDGLLRLCFQGSWEHSIVLAALICGSYAK
jgi:hypothetical protein